jgi:hypothetical protein
MRRPARRPRSGDSVPRLAPSLAGWCAARGLTVPSLPDQCLLCGAPPTHDGIFVPRNSVVFGGTVMQQRLIAYALCTACCAASGAVHRVEARLKERLTRSRGPEDPASADGAQGDAERR